ncbi:MAG: hypothetical protein GY711_05815 [bacterium]|nr:hypothetical protein [bacterium]
MGTSELLHPGHDGAFNSLEAMVRHQIDPVASLQAYDPSQAVLPPRRDLDAIDKLVHGDLDLRADVPNRVPSGLPVFD